MNHSGLAPVLSIAPAPILVAAGQKRKLVVNSASDHSIHTAAAAAVATLTASRIPRLQSAPSTLAPVVDEPLTIAKPSDYWKSLLEEWNVPILDTVGIEQELDKSNVVFVETTADRVEAYQNIELLTAVRRRDLVVLNKIAAEKRAAGTTMNACNRFGESLLHLACRKGSFGVVELMVGPSCDCSLLVRDDYGRTVLHDACWTVNPPWDLIKLILKKAPVLWRVSDVRGHLALQYVPKTAWPQWWAFLSKNKDLLQRIMVHSYHNIDILNQQPPQQQHQHQQMPIKQEAVPATGSSTDDASALPKQNLPQHQQPLTQALPQSMSRPAATQVSNEQAQNVLAKVLAQANPALVLAISRPQTQPLRQGLTSFAPVAPPETLSTATTMQAGAETTQVKQQPQPAAPGPATAALDEALRAQSATRSKARSGLMHNDQQREGDRVHKQPASPSSSSSIPHPELQETTSASAPLPYAPSISMIAERLAGYKKNIVAAAAAAFKQEASKAVPGESPQPSTNPLPAVPNPLFQAQDPGRAAVPSRPPAGVPSSITTTTKNRRSDRSVPNPMLEARTDCASTNNIAIGTSVSSMTMSAASPGVMEESVSVTSNNGTTDTDSDGVTPTTSSTTNNSSQEDAEGETEASMDTTSSSGESGDNDGESGKKPVQDGSKKRVIG